MSLSPLSPHLQTYRLPLSAWLSILHRGTGLLLALSLPLCAWAFYSLSSHAAVFANFLSYAQHPLGYALLIAWSFSLFYHCCNGLRHLCWDIGWGFKKNQIQNSAYAVIFISLLLTIGFWSQVFWGNA